MTAKVPVVLIAILVLNVGSISEIYGATASRPHAYANLDPGKPIRWIDPFPPGGGTDVLARAVAPRLTEAIGNAIVVDNRPGAAGNIAVSTVAKSTPDGYTIGTISATHSIYPSINPNLPYDILKDVTPIVQLSSQPYLLVANSGFAPTNVSQLIALAKAKPGQVNYGSAGVGGLSHLAGALFEILAKIEMSHVPYKGAPPALVDLLSGQIQILFSSPLAGQSHVKSGRLKAFGVTSTARMRSMPEVPTIAESGLPGFDVTGWYGVVAPAKVPPNVIAKLNAAIAHILQTTEVRDRMIADGAEPAGGTSQAFSAFIAREVDKWRKVVNMAKIRVD